MEIIRDIEQLSPEWFELRVGSLGGSTISTAVSRGAGRKTLMQNMVAEILSGRKKQGYVSYDMKQGIVFEPKAREYYEMDRLPEGEAVEQISMIRGKPHTHYSADGLVGHNGMVEIKVRIESVYVDIILNDTLDTSVRRQCQWGLCISGRDWVDYVAYCPYLTDPDVKPMYVRRIERDEREIAELKVGADLFIGEMLAMLQEVKDRSKWSQEKLWR